MILWHNLRTHILKQLSGSDIIQTWVTDEQLLTWFNKKANSLVSKVKNRRNKTKMSNTVLDYIQITLFFLVSLVIIGKSSHLLGIWLYGALGIVILLLKLLYAYIGRRREEIELRLYFEKQLVLTPGVIKKVPGFEQMNTRKKRKFLNSLKNPDGYGWAQNNFGKVSTALK